MNGLWQAVSAVAGVLLASPAFAETGVRTFEIDNLSFVFGRAARPAARITGALASRDADVDCAGRGTLASGGTRTVLSAGCWAATGEGRS